MINASYYKKMYAHATAPSRLLNIITHTANALRQRPYSIHRGANRRCTVWRTITLIGALQCPIVALALNDDAHLPIQIEADQVELDEKRQVSTYSGRVSMLQGSIRVHADTIVINAKNEKLQDIVARGKPARFRQRPEGQTQDVEAEALEVIYRAPAGTVTLRGDALMSQGQNVFRGEHIFYDMNANVVRANSGNDAQSRVRVTIDPNSVQKRKPEAAR